MYIYICIYLYVYIYVVIFDGNLCLKSKMDPPTQDGAPSR